MSYSTASLDELEQLEAPQVGDTTSATICYPTEKSRVLLEPVPTKRLAFTDRYCVRKLICEGGQAKVHKAYDKVSCKEVAIKVYSKQEMKLRDLEAIHREKNIMETLSHPCVVQLRDFHEDQEHIYMVMDLMLSDMRDLMIEVNAPVKERDARSLFYHMVASVQHIHQNQVIHRDLKLENFLIDEDKNSRQIMVKLIDFGLATFYDSECPPSQKCGTLVTVAPEVFTAPHYDYKVDCWSLGVILFELLSNDLPFFDKDAKKFKE